MVHATLGLARVIGDEATAQPYEMGKGKLASLHGRARPMSIDGTVCEHTSLRVPQDMYAR
jgi:hypothetical protein